MRSKYNHVKIYILKKRNPIYNICGWGFGKLNR